MNVQTQHKRKGVLTNAPVSGVLRTTRGLLKRPTCALTRGGNALAETSASREVVAIEQPSAAIAAIPSVIWLPPEADAMSCIVNAIVPAGTANVAETPNWTNAEYHARRDSVSTSTLKKILRSPAHMKAYWDEPNKKTASRVIFSAVHSAVLEPTEFAKDYVVWTGGDRRGKKYEDFQAANPGKEVLKADEYRAVLGMRDAIMAYEDYPIGDLISTGENEKTIIWVDQETGVRCKVRPDNLNAYGILDLKGTDDCRPNSFIRLQCVPLFYDLQAYMYTEGVFQLTGERRDFYFVAVEETAPHSVWVHQASPAMLESGRVKFRRALELYVKCMETNTFPGYESPSSIIEWPRYAESRV